MSLTLLGWFLLTVLGWVLIASSIVISALLIFRVRSIGARPGSANPNEAVVDAKGPALSSALLSSSLKVGQGLRGTTGTVLVAAAVFVLIVGIGAAMSFFGEGATGSRGTTPISRSGADGDLARLKDYTRSIATEEPAPKAAASDLLPDVNTMIEKLAARLQAAPDDSKGWRMLGWSYFNTASYEQAATAYARAMELEPNSADLKRAYEEAKEKASGSGYSATASSSQSESAGKNGDGPHAEKMAKSEAAPPLDTNPAIRAMVDGLANRLEASPRDADGWARLMRSRVVLGEREVAATAFRKALDVFKDDPAASDKITAAASELGLKVE
ncbi:MAG: tetratricopeptide repeat protein [Rhodospirillales bacterium]|nr:tetratricopeptide repeat protein [Rhodospirillales bacterium]